MTSDVVTRRGAHSRVTACLIRDRSTNRECWNQANYVWRGAIRLCFRHRAELAREVGRKRTRERRAPINGVRPGGFDEEVRRTTQRVDTDARRVIIEEQARLDECEILEFLRAAQEFPESFPPAIERPINPHAPLDPKVSGIYFSL